MFMVVRVWDAINDPIMGNIVHNTKSKWGKFRPWILAGTVLNAIIVLFIFINPGLAPTGIEYMIYITVFYTLWGMSYTLMDIPFWSMIPALSRSKRDRESVTAITRFFTTVGFALISAPYLAFAALFGSGSMDAEAATNTEMRKGFLILVAAVSILFVISQIIMVLNVKEEVITEDVEKVSLKKMFKLLVDNDQLMVVMVVVLVTNFVLYITSTMAFYYIAYNLGDENLVLPFMALGLVVQLASIAMYPFLSNVLSRKKLYNLSILVQVFACVGLLINALLLKDNMIILFVFGAGVFFGQGLGMVLTTLLLSDTVEYGELKLGERSESTVFSVQTFVVKLATGLSMGAVGLGLQLIGFKANAEDEALLSQSDSTLLGISLMMFVLPIIGMLLSRYIFNKYHKIDEEAYEGIVKELELKNGVLNE
jgi:melibiose permease